MTLPHPTLRAGLAVVEMSARGESHYVVKDPDTGRYLRLGAAEGRVLRAFDGRRSPADVARLLAEEGLRVSVATVEAFARACSRKGLLERTTAERSILQLERLRAERGRRRSLFRGELLRMRWSFADPDAHFDRAMPLLRWCFGPAAVAGSLALLAVALLLVVDDWARLRTAFGALADPANLTGGRVLLLWCSLLLVTLLHELGHAFTCKHFGGGVHEMGFMLVYFQPAFYCNVNDAWSFPSLRARLWVTAAGAWVELVLGAIAAIVWWLAQPGTLLADVALMFVFFSGGLALLTNANPLLPFDGYFALSDWLGIPNLRQRGLAHWGWWVRRHVLRLDLPEPPAAPGERRILLRYGACAAAYIAVVLVVTLLVVTGWARRHLGPLAWLLAVPLVFLFARATLPGWGRTLRDAAALHGSTLRRMITGGRSRRVVAVVTAALLGAAVLPWPIATGGTFEAVSAGSAAYAVATQPGVVAAVLVREGDRVAAGDAVLVLTDPGALRAVESLGRDADSLAAGVRLARARGAAADARIVDAAGHAAATRAIAAQEAIVRRTIRAPAAGVVATAHPERLLGRHVAVGTAVLQLADADSVELRISLARAGAVLVRPGLPVRLVSHADPSRPLAGHVSSVAVRGDTAGGRSTVEARVRVPRGPAWRPGITGEARVRLHRSTLLGAAWWAIRARLRTDLLL